MIGDLLDVVESNEIGYDILLNEFSRRKGVVGIIVAVDDEGGGEAFVNGFGICGYLTCEVGVDGYEAVEFWRGVAKDVEMEG